jgi:hypothetical protein
VIAALASPLGRWAGIAAVCAALAGWAWLERAGRQVAAAELREARQHVAAIETRIRHMETRNAEDDRARRSSDPIGELRREFSRD